MAEGHITTANRFLGRPYSLTGTVVKGQQLGRTIGFPTANLQIDDPVKLIPANGVYAVEVIYKDQTPDRYHTDAPTPADRIHGGMLNIGLRPTIGGTHQTIETYIFDFDADIYGEHPTLQIREFLRSEQKSPGLPALIAQLKQDEQQARAVL